ncbi:cation:proton antiporter, partial [bacterium]|nr:cation:proton antiporter [bacterium]
MESVFIALGALIAITIFGILAQRAPSFPFPIILVLGGLLVSLIPDAPQIRLDPAVFFILFLPPLLYADGWLMNLRDFKAARRPILLLSIGLVIFTTLAVGWVVHLLMPDLPWSVCFALGAVISPTDAVAVSAITERLKVPHRIVTILNGESLVNDASGLVAFKFAVVATLTGTFNLMDVGFSFLWLSAGGICIGLIVAFL